MRGGSLIFRRGNEAGDHELEADVMRFVAILALCIVAISTLVDEAAAPVSAPAPVSAKTLSPAPPAQTTPLMVPAPPVSPSASARTGGVEPITLPETPAAIRRLSPPVPAQRVNGEPRFAPRRSTPEPARMQTSARPETTPPPTSEVSAPIPTPASPESPRDSRPEAPEESPDIVAPKTEPEPVTGNEPASPTEPPPDPSEPQSGFTLRFESDAALLRLVARGAAEVYVFDGADTLRLSYGAGGPEFHSAPGPGQFHAIAARTVPALLQRVLVLDGRDPAAVVWGVTLPAATRADLARLIRQHEAGELVIDERGGIELEENHG